MNKHSGTMNYVGSISILDRGDAPAQAVIDRNARSMAQRVADDTKDELEKVMTRVETIYSSFEDYEQAFGTSNLEYIQDIGELEEIMKDQVKKKKYQQQVTIFIVGFSDVSGQKLRLMQQVNEFFTENSKNIEEEDWFPSTPDLDLEEVGDKINDSLQVARDLAQHLGDLNKEMVDYMATYAEKKASNKGKKKMEKALLQAKDEVQGLAEKLQSAQADLREKEEKLQATFKQLEGKNLEVQKFRTAAELAKKALQETEGLQEAIAERDLKILEQRQQLTRLEIDLAQSNHLKESSQNKLSNFSEETQQRITTLQKEVEDQKRLAEDVKRDFSQYHDEQLTALREVHQQNMEDMKKQHAEQIKSLSTDLQRTRTELATTQHDLLELQIEKGVSETQSEAGRQFDLESEDGTSRQSAKQKPMVIAVRQKRGGKHKESRPSTKGRGAGLKKGGSKSGGKEGKGGRTSASGSSVASDELDPDLVLDDLESSPGEDGEVGTQDEGGDPNAASVDEKRQTPATRHSRRSRSTLAPVEEFEGHDDVYDLTDEEAWSTIPKDQLEGRFAQYRRICQHKLREVDEQRQLTVAKTQRKVQLLKSQFVEHKTKWETERKVLIAQVEQAQQLQVDAEKEADQAMTQLEDFITEQERLEEEEETQRSAILRGASGSSLSLPAPCTPGPSAPRTPLPTGTPASVQPTPPDSRNTQSSEELQNLMQQTDDAKSQRQNSKHTSPSSTATPGAMGALLDVSRIPVHKHQPSPTSSTTPVTSPACPDDGHAPAEGHTSPAIVEAPAEASEQAKADSTEAAQVSEIVEESIVEHTEPVMETAEVVEAVEEARAVSVEEQEALVEENGEKSPAKSGTATPGSRSASAAGGRESVPALDMGTEDSASPLEGGEWVSDLPTNLPVLMLMGGRVTSASVLADAPSSRPTAGQGSRSVPGSRQSQRVLIMQPKSVPGSAKGVALGTRGTADAASSLSSGGSFVPMALDVGALMNPKIATPYSPTPASTAPASAAPQREVTRSAASMQREGTHSADLARETAPSASMQREVSVTGEGQATAETSDVVAKEGKSSAQPVADKEGSSLERNEGVADDTGTGTGATEELPDAKSELDQTTPGSAQAKLESAQSKPGSAQAKPESALAKPESAGAAREGTDRKGDARDVEGEEEGLPDGAQGLVAPETLTPAEMCSLVEELRGRVTGTKSAPPGVDMTMVEAGDAEGQTTAAAVPDRQRAKTAAASSFDLTAVPVIKGSQLLQLAAMDSITTGMTVPVVFGEGRQVVLFDITPGVVTPYPAIAEAEVEAQRFTTTFLTPEGHLVVTDPMSPQEGAAQGLVAVEVRPTPSAAMSAPPISREVSGVRTTSSAGILRTGSRPSPASSPTRQVSFALRDSRASSSSPHEGVLSPRLSRLRRSRTGEGMPSDLSVVMETSLPAAQEQTLESMRKMLMEESLAPKQQVMLDSMRSALSVVKSHRLGEKGRADSAVKLLGERGRADGSSRLTSDEMLRTMTVFTLASQLSQEAFKLGVRPNSIFRNFSRLDTHLLSEITPQASRKGQPEGVSRETTTADLPRSTSDIEKNMDGASSAEDATRQVILEELQDLPPIDGTPADEASTPSLHPPATAATIGSSVPAHDQPETPLAEEGDKDVVQGGGELKEDTPDAMIKVTGDVEEDLREASVRSRASLRSDYKKRLEESRQAAEDRRTKSPQIKLPTNLSIDDELVLDDDEEEEFEDDIALPDDVKEELEEVRRREIWRDETATTPPPSKQPSSFSLRLAAGKWSKLLDHPILQEYLKTYHAVASFKDTLSKLFLDKDMMSASQIVSDLETLVFETDKKVMPQIEQFTSNVAFILEEIASVINSAVMVDREPPVSSLLPFSRDETRGRLPPTRQDSSDLFPSFTPLPKQVTPIAAPLLPPDQLQQQQAPAATAAMGLEPAVIMETKEPLAELEGAGDMEGPPSQAGSVQGSRKSSVSDSATKQQLADLQSQCSQLQVQLVEESKKHEEQLRHNTVVMMEMQDTINDLQRELSAIGKTTKKPRSAASASHLSAKTPSPDQSLMFTRLDLERNAKIMKKAVLDQRLDADKYKEAVTTMDDYVGLPAQRLAHLVKKYVHHSRMKEIEENVKNSESLDEGVFDTLDKMEALQNQRARQWAEKMDSMGIERLRLAAMLMDSLDTIEQESGLFLIKPMYSYRGRELKVPPTQKLARPLRSQPVPRHQSAAHESTASFVPAPTPASNARRLDRQTPNLQMVTDFVPPPSRPEDGVVGSGAIRNTAAPPSAPLMNQPYQTWNMSVSQTRSPMDSLQHSLNTPRMLELDINRMLIGQNNVSTKLPHPPTDDRLVNASNNSLRSYVTVQRPAASLAAERPPSAQGGRDTGAPPCSPSPRPPVAISPADRDLPHAIASPPPLPPIGDRSPSALSSHPDEPEPPHSPPGSSMYQSTTHDQEEGNEHKSTMRASSQVSLLGEDDQ